VVKECCYISLSGLVTIDELISEVFDHL
jgi:hypothetical protein